MPVTAEQILADPRRCGYYGYKSSRSGGPCGEWVIKGTTTGQRHAGKTVAKAQAEGAVRLAAKRWGLGDTSVDPGEYLLRLVSQSAHRVELYAGLLQQAYQAAEELQAAHRAEELRLQRPGADDDGEPDPALQAAYANVRRVFATGGVGALIGVKLDATKDGRVYATEEAIRGLAQLELQERKFGADLAAKAVAAGLAERMVRLAERQGALMAQFVIAVAARLGLTSAQQAALPGAIEAEVINLTEGATA